MPKDTFTLSDVREPTLTILCEPCGRRRRYNVEKLIAKHGDAKILFLLSELTNCPKTQSATSTIVAKCAMRGSRLDRDVLGDSPGALGGRGRALDA